MSTVTESEVVADVTSEGEPYPISSDVYFEMVERGLIPEERRVYLWDGRLYEKMAKTKIHASVHNTVLNVISRRLSPGNFMGTENPVRLDDRHTPLPDLVVLRSDPLGHQALTRYLDHREVALVAEIAVTSLKKDLGERLSRYALALPLATYVVVDISHRLILVHRDARADPETGRGVYGSVEAVGPGQSVRLSLDGIDLDPIPFEELLL